jgi:FKBP-type peptidyl-prolyl cis-trans isomerase (trigger factor)
VQLDDRVTLDVVENLRHIRKEVRGGDNNRDVDWELGKDTTFDGGPDKEKSVSDQVTFHVKLPARDKDGKAEKIVQKFHVILKNEW